MAVEVTSKETYYFADTTNPSTWAEANDGGATLTFLTTHIKVPYAQVRSIVRVLKAVEDKATDQGWL